MKLCQACQKLKQDSEFGKNRGFTCKVCCYEDLKRWRKDHPERLLAHNRKQRYGISDNEVTLLWDMQDGKCGICDYIFKKDGDFHIDHDHKTGRIRGLLCKDCNLGLGYFRDNIDLLHKAMKWIGY